MHEYVNVFYFDKINSIGGVETFFYEIAKKYCANDITILYSTGDINQIDRLKKFVRVREYHGEKIKCKKAFFNYSLKPIENIIAEKYYEIIHANYKQLHIKPNTHPLIDEYIGVSQSVCDAFTEITNLPCKLCYNPITIEEPRRVLNLISATRLTHEKGKNRIIKLAKALDDAEIPFIWTIFTNNKNVIDHPRIIYMEPELNIRNYIAKADYTVQLSDTEAYCYTIIESLLLKTPIIVTPWECLKELKIDDKVGFILPFDMDNIPVEDIYNKIFTINYQPPADKWDTFIEKSQSNYLEEKKYLYKVKALDTYKKINIADNDLKKVPEEGDTWLVEKDRLDILLGNNYHKKVFVELIDKVKKEGDN